MKKRDRVKSSILFSEIIKKGQRGTNKLYSIFFVNKEDEDPLFGVSAPVKLGNAVVRNKLKRQLRALIDETKNLFKNKRNYIIIVKEEFKNSTYNMKLEYLKKLIGEINEK